jgi:hypothetical protein
MELSARLRASVDIDVPGEFTAVSSAMADADLGEVTFDAGPIVEVVAGILPPGLVDVHAAVQAVAQGLATAVPSGQPLLTATVDIEGLASLLAGLGPSDVEVAVAAETGLAALATRVETVRTAVTEGTIGELLALAPGVSLPAVTPRVGGAVGGLVVLLQVLGGLAATSAVSDRLATRAERLGRLLDLDRARNAGDLLAERTADTGLVAAIRDGDPDDPDTVSRAVDGVIDFQDGVAEVAESWSIGMGFGEAALGNLDLAGSAVALEAARVVLAADLTSVGELATGVRQVLSPVIDVPLPAPGAIVGSAVDQGLALVGQLTGAVQAWDAAAVAGPVREVVGSALAPLTEAGQALDAAGTELGALIRELRGLLEDLDLAPIAGAVNRALQPVVDALDVIEDGVAEAETTLTTVCGNISTALGTVASAVSAAANRINGALATLQGELDELGLQDLADRLASSLQTVGDALASAQLSPYFDAAIEVIDTVAEVVDAVPFSLLPTDVQQEVVDACQPIKQLDLQEVEDTLRAELAEIRGSLQADALDALEAAYAAVVEFLASLNPATHLEALEAEGGPLAELEARVAAVDPETLLAPATAALDQFRSLLDSFDLESAVVQPLTEALAPVRDALDALDPVALLEPVQQQVDLARDALTGLLRLDEAEAVLAGFRERVVEVLGAVDPAGLAAVLDQTVAEQLRRPAPGNPADALGSLVAALGQATGLEAEEAGVGEALAWIGGGDGAAAVRDRLMVTAQALSATRDAVASLDPTPLVAAAQAQRRAIDQALSVHPPDSGLRSTLDPLLAGRPPNDTLGPLVENRRRYLAALDAAVGLASMLAASGRSEVRAASTGLRAALVPLDTIPARVRAVLAALGLAAGDEPFTEVLAHLLETAGPERLVPALAGLVEAARDKAIEALDALLVPANETVASARTLLDAFDLGPVVAELQGLHAEAVGFADALDPSVLLGDVLDAAQAAIDRLRAFDPLAPVRGVLDAAQAAADQVFQSARPTVVFAPVVGLHATVMGLATGLDVRELLAPVLAALDGLGIQLDEGFDRTGDALQALQAALPGGVSNGSASGGAEVELGVTLG